MSSILKTKIVVLTFALLTLTLLMGNHSAFAAKGDFSLDFIASAPKTYSHITGGGAYDDRTIGKANDVVESLEGADFRFGDIITFLIAVKVGNTQSATNDAPQTIEMDFSFLGDTTGQSGAGFTDIVYVGVNRGPIARWDVDGNGSLDIIGDGTGETDSGLIELPGRNNSVATLSNEQRPSPPFVPGAVLTGTVTLTDLDPGEQIIVRIDVKFETNPGSRPTGNLQATLKGTRLTYINGGIAVNPPGVVPGGAQTVPFRKIADVISPPTITVTKTANPTSVNEPGGNVTYTVTVVNTSTSDVIPDSLIDDKFGNLSGKITPGLPQTLAANGGSYSGTFTEYVSGDAGYIHTNTVTATAHNDAGSTSASDDATVTINDVLPKVKLTKTADPLSLAEPGGDFTFTIVITNESVEEVTITEFTDTNLLAPPAGLIGKKLAVGGSYSFTYTVNHTEANTYPNDASVTVEDNEKNKASANASAEVKVTDVLPKVKLTKSADPLSLSEPGGDFTFTIVITNESVEEVTITEFTDSNSPVLPVGLIGTYLAANGLPGDSVSFTYKVNHTNAGSYPNDASVTVIDNENNPATANASATVTVIDVIPSPTLFLVKKEVDANADGIFNDVIETIQGTTVTFRVTIENKNVEPLTITSVTDEIWYDKNGDGIQDAGEIVSINITDNPDDPNVVSTTCQDLIGTVLQPGGQPGNTFVGTFVVNFPETLSPLEDPINTVTIVAKDDEDHSVTSSDIAQVDIISLYQGLTPGYWKNHPLKWPSLYIPDGPSATKVGDPIAFDGAWESISQLSALAGDTLMKALAYPGGKGLVGAAQTLLRAGTAALLNAAHPDINYRYTEDEVRKAVEDALNSGSRNTMLDVATDLDNWNKKEGVSLAPINPNLQLPNMKPEQNPVPNKTRLLKNYPNPFNPETWIPYELAETANVKVQIFNITGNVVRTLDLGSKSAGYYVDQSKAAYWDGKNEANERVSSGIYFYTIQAGRFTATSKMVVEK